LLWHWSWALIALTAILAHLPALRGYFFQDDWTRLAAVLHGGGAGLLGPRPLSRVVGFELGFSLFGLRAAAWHASALCAWALASVLTQKLGLRMGLGPLAATVAGLLTAATPVVLLPVFWASAAAEIFAVLFGLLALWAWLHPQRWGAIVAVIAGLASFFCKESLLALPLLLLLLPSALLGESGATRAQRRWALLLLLAGAAAAAALVWKVMAPTSAHDPYAMGGPRLWQMNLLVLGAWLISPVSFAPLPTPSLPFFGALVWLAWLALAIRQARAGSRRELWWLLFALGSLAPVLPLSQHLQPYYLLGAVPAFAWSVGAALDLLQERVPLRPRLQPLLALLVALVALGVGYSASARRFEARDARGRLENPLALRSALAYQVSGMVRSLPLQPGETLAVLAATATEWPEEMPVQMAQRLNSKIYVAIDGEKGLSVMVPEGVSVRWDSHLDGLRADSMVLFDDGGTRLRFWGRVRNARFYSALLAMAAQQYPRAMHDLWVVGGKGARLDFNYQADLLPVSAEAIDENASPFVHYILSHEDDTTLARRLVLLFEQLYKAVRGKELKWATEPAGGSSPANADSESP
jgi:hypothetical protein